MLNTKQPRPLERDAFKWPSPPYFKVIDEADNNAPERCIVELLNQKELPGLLVRFSPDQNRVLFKAFNSQDLQIIAFDQIKNLQLLSQISITPEQSFLEQRAQEVFSPSKKQIYHVDFVDGTKRNGETFGYVNNDIGLFLYHAAKNDKVEKHFIPRQAVRDYQVGMQIGDILVEEKHVKPQDIELALAEQKKLKLKRVGDYLNENKVISEEDLHQAILRQSEQPVLKLGEALKELDLLTDYQLEEALRQQKENRNVRLGQILIDMGVVDDRTLKGTLAQKLGIPFVDLSKFNFDMTAVRKIDKSIAKKHTLLPLCIHDDMLVVAFEDPMNIAGIDELRYVAQMNVLPAMATRSDIVEKIEEFYRLQSNWEEEPSATEESIEETPDPVELSSGDELAKKLFDEGQSSSPTEFERPDIVAESTLSENTLVQLVNKMITDATRDKVSDIHIESYPGKKNTLIRFRKDGSLSHYLEVPANYRNAFISRIKVMSHLNISERRKPQDGKIDFQQFGPEKVELRVATIPTTNGLEDVVMRVLAASKPIPLNKLGFTKKVHDSLTSMISKPYGLMLVCGPTGSGKTTSLHSLLGNINKPERKIWTAEDPVEISQPGLRQVQVNAKIGWSFADAMRSFLRADPDVIMVGEMRDQETTKIGIEASLTGHLVLSTLHTNSAPESVTRMLDIGMDPFNFADALLGILAQRLAKALCQSCKEPYEATEAELEALATEYVLNTHLDGTSLLKSWKNQYTQKGKVTLYKAKGCDACNKTGYSGRMGLYELMTVTPAIKKLIQNRATIKELVDEAIDSGMVTLKQDGITKVLAGDTDITQVRAVCA